MIKICPECLNINHNNPTCEYCGFPLDKKILGQFEEYHLHSIIELINDGRLDEASSKIQETPAAEMTTKLSILKDKISKCQSLLNGAKELYAKASELCKAGNYSRALEAIDQALKIHEPQAYIDLRSDIIQLDQIGRTSQQASMLYNQGQTAIKLNDVQKGLRLIKQAIELEPGNAEFISGYQTGSNEFVTQELQKISTLIKEGDFTMANFYLNEIRPYALPSHNLDQYEQQIETKTKRKKGFRRLVRFFLIVIPIASIVYFGGNYWMNKSSVGQWKAFCSTAKIADYKKYIQDPVDDKYLQAAKDSLKGILASDSTVWMRYLKTKEKSNALDYINRMTKYGGLHLEEANQAIDSLDWVQIANSKDAVVFEDYIRNHPNSKFIALARRHQESQLTAKDKEFGAQYLGNFFSAWSNKDINQLLGFFGPLTNQFFDQTNIAKASLEGILMNQLRATIQENIVIDNASLNGSKDSAGNFNFTVIADIRSFEQAQMDYSSTESTEETIGYYSNVEYSITINAEWKISSITYRVLSKQQTNY
jgi:tetratricopeptide (TPR) repeat protein